MPAPPARPVCNGRGRRSVRSFNLLSPASTCSVFPGCRKNSQKKRASHQFRAQWCIAPRKNAFFSSLFHAAGRQKLDFALVRVAASRTSPGPPHFPSFPSFPFVNLPPWHKCAGPPTSYPNFCAPAQQFPPSANNSTISLNAPKMQTPPFQLLAPIRCLQTRPNSCAFTPAHRFCATLPVLFPGPCPPCSLFPGCRTFLFRKPPLDKQVRETKTIFRNRAPAPCG